MCFVCQSRPCGSCQSFLLFCPASFALYRLFLQSNLEKNHLYLNPCSQLCFQEVAEELLKNGIVLSFKRKLEFTFVFVFHMFVWQYQLFAIGKVVLINSSCYAIVFKPRQKSLYIILFIVPLDNSFICLTVQVICKLGLKRFASCKNFLTLQSESHRKGYLTM